MKELILIRHAEAEYLTMGLTGGWTDSKLTDQGFKQARLTGKRMLAELRRFQFSFFVVI
ncbi:MAG: phosphoglycerate mutase family protein [Candidatus Hodarchaeales archaeon]